MGTITIASLPDREELVAELWIDDVQLAEISMEERVLRIEIYPHPTGRPWALDLNDLTSLVGKAKTRLAEVTGLVLD